MRNKNPFWKLGILLLILALIVPVLAACDDDDDDETTQPTATQSSAAESTTTPIDTSPIKIGVITDYSGPTAVAGVLADQALDAMDLYIEEEFGGDLLGGRPIEWVKYDCKSQVASAQAGAKKLALDDDIALILVQASSTICEAVQEECERLKVPFLNGTQAPNDMTPYKYAVRTTMSNDQDRLVTDFVINVLKPKKVALLGNNMTAEIEATKRRGHIYEDAGIEIVYEGQFGEDVKDVTPYLTRIKREEPDVLDNFLVSQQVLAIVNQITGLGGWQDIQMVDSSGGGIEQGILEAPGGDSTYHWTTWIPGLDYPGARQFERIWNEKYGENPQPFNFWAWACVTAGLHIIDQAGTTDRDEIARFMRSGELSFEGLNGPYTIGKDGITNMTGIIVQVQDKQFVPVYSLAGPM